MFSTIPRRIRARAGCQAAAVTFATACVAASTACRDAHTISGVTAASFAAASPCPPTCGTPTPIPVAPPSWFKAFGSGVSVTRFGDTVFLKSNGVPDHKSPYFPRTDPRYEKYTGTNPDFFLNPNRIDTTHSFTFRIPANPKVAKGATPTDLGPIGIALNGVPLYNQYANMGVPVDSEADTFDQYNGHPQADDIYHYHWEPLWLTRASKEALVGVLLDGFPVYGPREYGKLVLAKSLDAAHGHYGATAEFPSGIYHYHTTSTAPYINGSGYAGKPGMVTYY